MTIAIADIRFRGPYSRPEALERRPGVYAVLDGRRVPPLEVGVAEDVRREVCDRCGNGGWAGDPEVPSFAVFYTALDDNQRRIETALREAYGLDDGAAARGDGGPAAANGDGSGEAGAARNRDGAAAEEGRRVPSLPVRAPKRRAPVLATGRADGALAASLSASPPARPAAPSSVPDPSSAPDASSAPSSGRDAGADRPPEGRERFGVTADGAVRFEPGPVAPSAAPPVPGPAASRPSTPPRPTGSPPSANGAGGGRRRSAPRGYGGPYPYDASDGEAGETRGRRPLP